MIKPKDMAKKLNVTVLTLRNWEKQGKIKSERTPTGRRYYTEEELNRIMGNISNRKNVIYSRVSTRSQLKDLENQINFIQEYANSKGYIIDEIFSDVGSGLNYKRKDFNKLLLEMIPNKEIDTIFITYEDRLARFGFDWFKEYCLKFGTKIVVLNQLKSSPQEELVNDLISIITVFSERVYGLRRYKSQIKEVFNEKEEN